MSLGYLEIRYGNCEIFIQFLAFKPTKDVDDDDNRFPISDGSTKAYLHHTQTPQNKPRNTLIFSPPIHRSPCSDLPPPACQARPANPSNRLHDESSPPKVAANNQKPHPKQHCLHHPRREVLPSNMQKLRRGRELPMVPREEVRPSRHGDQ